MASLSIIRLGSVFKAVAPLSRVYIRVLDILKLPC